MTCEKSLKTYINMFHNTTQYFFLKKLIFFWKKKTSPTILKVINYKNISSKQV